MRIDATTFRAIAAPMFPHEPELTPLEARAITQLCYLASDTELDDDDDDERALREQIGRHVCTLANMSFDSVPWPSPLPLPNDDEARRAWLVRLCRWLVRPNVRELAYVLAYLLAIGDLALRPVETVFMTELQETLGLGDERAAHLVARADQAVTAGVGGAEARPA
jgi:hypothetical protein